MIDRNVLFSIVAATAAFGLSSGAALGGTFSISPIRIDLSGAATTGALTVRNEEAVTVVVQADGFAWEQSGGEDRLSASRDLLVSPAVFTLPPNGSQLVRVALRRGADPRQESSYRLMLQEVPQPASPDFNGLKVSLRLSLPVFVAPLASAEPRLAWSAGADASGHLVITGSNSGNAHARILKFSVAPADGSAGGFEQMEAAYVLPGQSRSWTFDNKNQAEIPAGPTLADARLFRLKGITDKGEFAADLAVVR
jgi:fimbrial chaperone protein